MSRHPDSGDRLAAAHAHLVRAVEDLADSDAWRRMLDVAARFPTYSANNVLLIGVQRPDATRVAGIRTWNSVGRHVRKGEKGIAILAPCLYRPRDPEPKPAPKTGGPDPAAGPEGEAARRLRGFRIVYVWDLAQTDGRPLDDISPAEVRGAAPPELVARLSAALADDGYTVERGPCGAAYGYTDFQARTVRVRADIPDGQAAKTLAHDLLTAPTAPPGGDLWGAPRRHAVGRLPLSGSWSTAAAVAPLTSAEEVSRGVVRRVRW